MLEVQVLKLWRKEYLYTCTWWTTPGQLSHVVSIGQPDLTGGHTGIDWILSLGDNDLHSSPPGSKCAQEAMPRIPDPSSCVLPV
jgi:hypothetical protein